LVNFYDSTVTNFLDTFFNGVPVVLNGLAVVLLERCDPLMLTSGFPELVPDLGEVKLLFSSGTIRSSCFSSSMICYPKPVSPNLLVGLATFISS
jgi:hypothetical protein